MNEDILIDLVKGLSVKIDDLPTRREFDSLNTAVADVRKAFGDYVLRTEWKLQNENNVHSMTATSKTYDDKLIAIEKRFEPLEAKIGEVGKPPSWLIAVLIGIGINVGAVAVEHYIPSGTNSAITTTTSSSIISHH